jgi:hypothetical protein
MTTVLKAEARISATDDTGDTFARIGAKIRALESTAKGVSKEFAEFSKSAAGVSLPGGRAGTMPTLPGGRRRGGEESGYGGGSAVMATLAGLVTFNVATAVMHIAETTIKAAADVEHEREMWKLASGKPQEFEAMQKIARELGDRYGQTTAEVLKTLRELYAIFGDVEHAKEAAEPLIQAETTAIAHEPSKTEEVKEEFARLVKGLETTNQAKSMETFKYALEQTTKAMNNLGSTMKPEAVFQMYQKGRLASQAWDSSFRFGVAPLLAQEMGGPNAGTALQAFYSQFGSGVMSHRAALLMQSLGLAKTDKMAIIPGTKEVQGVEVLGAKLAEKNPMEWLHNILLPVLQDHGIKRESDLRHILGKIASRPTGGQAMSIMLTQRKRLMKDMANIKEAAGLEGAEEIMALDPYMAQRRREARVKNAAAPLAKDTVTEGGAYLDSVVNALTGGLDAFRNAADPKSETNKAIELWWKTWRPAPLPPDDKRTVDERNRDIDRKRKEDVQRWEARQKLLPWPTEPQAPATGEINRIRQQQWPQFQRREVAPRAEAAAAAISGRAEMDIKVTVVPTDAFTAMIDARIDSKIRNLDFSGGPAIGTMGQTGHSMPEVGRERQ